MHVQMMIAATILTQLQWQHPVASIKALDLLYWVMCTVLYQRTTTAIKMTSKNGGFCQRLLFHPTMVAAGAIQSKFSPNWGYPLSSSEAINLLYWVMCPASHQHVWKYQNSQQWKYISSSWMISSSPSTIIWAPANDNGCRVGDHCPWRVIDFEKIQRSVEINIYFILQVTMLFLQPVVSTNPSTGLPTCLITWIH
jgi:hypothetical protein